MMTLKDWENASEAGTRFPPSKFHCPQCGKWALQDNWPPNYGGGSGYFDLATGGMVYESGGNIKCVCLDCRIAFVVHVFRRTQGVQEIEAVETVHDVVPLVESGDYLLTPHDVYRENYKAEHGGYPGESYA